MAVLTHIAQSLSSYKGQDVGGGIDPELYYQLVMLARGVAVQRPHNLARFADAHQNTTHGPPTELLPISQDDTEGTVRLQSDFFVVKKNFF